MGIISFYNENSAEQSTAQDGFSHKKHRQGTNVSAVFTRLIIFHTMKKGGKLRLCAGVDVLTKGADVRISQIIPFALYLQTGLM